MRVVMPEYIENATTEAEIASNQLYNAYMALFQEFQRTYASSLPSGYVIDDLISYFKALDLVTNTSSERPKNKFYRLPLDEPYFEINIDSRTITVPSAFLNYGLGVQGDANAEIVFFKCPRLYDTVDLFAMVDAGNCYVQWANSTARTQGNSQVLLCDATQDYMLLGWLITPTITSSSGSIEFSVRWFVKDGQDRITYSLSTQKATCPIKATLDLNLTGADIEDNADIVYNRPIYANVINSMEGLAPRITKQLVSGTVNLEPINPETQASLLEQYPVATYPSGIKVFEVAATTPDNKSIVYQWYKDNRELAQANTNTYIAVAPGYYHVVIGNGDSTNGYRYITSPSVFIPAPEDIKFVNEAANKYFGCGAYSINDGQDHMTMLTADISTVNNAAPNGAVTVDWYFAPMKVNDAIIGLDDAVFTKVQGASQTLAVQSDKTYVTSKYTPPANTEGWYKCKAVSALNNATSAEIETDKVITVRAMPTKPTTLHIVYDSENEMLKVDTLTFSGASNDHPDEWHYQWNNGSEISAVNGGNGFGDMYKNLRIVYPETNATITYFVKVSHRVYSNNKVNALADAGTATQQESEYRASNTITLSFAYNGQSSTPTITVVE